MNTSLLSGTYFRAPVRLADRRPMRRRSSERLTSRVPCASVFLRRGCRRGASSSSSSSSSPTDRRVMASGAVGGRLPATHTEHNECADDVIPWAISKGAEPTHCKLAVRDLGGGRGRGLVATEAVSAGETLLSVPFTLAFLEDAAESASSDGPWSSSMALRILRILSSRGDGTSEMHSDSHLLPWAAALPPRIDTPPIQFTDGELDACLDGNTIKEARLMRGAHREGFRELADEVAGMGLSAADFDWAVSVLHSRCFVLQPSGLHITVPVIDMANHSFTPNAVVRAAHSPETCQGRSAVEDVCDPPEPEPSRFELLAGDAAISAGEEVTISYGSWPNDLFFLLFGFLPNPNPHDSLVLFDGAEEVLHFVNDTAAQSGAPHWKAEQEEVAVVEAAASAELKDTDFGRLVVTWDGFDARMMPALHAAIQQHPAAEHITAGELAVERCISMWSRLRSQTQQQQRELQSDDLTANMKLSLQYSFHKQELLENALRSVGMLN